MIIKEVVALQIFKIRKRNSKNFYGSFTLKILTTNTGTQIDHFHKLNSTKWYFRDTLKRNYNLHKYYLEVNIEDLGSFDETLADKLTKQPSEYVALFEEAAREVADELTAPRPKGEEEVEDIQVMLTSDANPSNLRELKVN